MRSSASRRISSLVMFLLHHEGADRVTGDGPFDVSFALEVEYQDRQFGALAQVDGGSVHDAKIIADDLAVRQSLVAHRGRIALALLPVPPPPLRPLNRNVA